MNIIITNIGRRGYLVEYFRALPDMKGKIYVSDCDRTASGLYGNNDGAFILSKPVDDEIKYINELIGICREKDITVVIPVIDPEIYILSGYLDAFAEKGIRVVVSSRQVLDICFDKTKMNEFLRSIDMVVPKTYVSLSDFKEAYERGEIFFPVVLKPALGSGSVDTFFPTDFQKLEALYHKGMIIQEKIEGTEYGVDVFNSFKGAPLRCVIKKKISMRSGETDKCVSVHNAIIESAIIKLAEALGHIGNLDCDVLFHNDTVYVIDMNPRFGGGYPATHTIGVNFVEILYKILNGEEVDIDIGNYKDHILVMKEIAIKSTVLCD